MRLSDADSVARSSGVERSGASSIWELRSRSAPPGWDSCAANRCPHRLHTGGGGELTNPHSGHFTSLISGKPAMPTSHLSKSVLENKDAELRHVLCNR